MGQGSSFH